MQASKVTGETLRAAAQEVGVQLDLTALNQAGTRWRVKVNPGELPREAYYQCGTCKGSGRDPLNTARNCSACRGTGRSWRRRAGNAGNAKYQRISASTFNQGRRVAAVCWHGFRDFFRAVYTREPEAIFRTSLDTWKGSEDFEARFRFSGHKNIGSQMAPMMFAEACECEDSGYAG